MQYEQNVLNKFLVEIFHEILKIEEKCISVSRFKNLSVREMHVIEAVCDAAAEGASQKAADIAKRLNITAGTLSTAVSLLEKKGYLLRRRDKSDKRVVRIYPTSIGHEANAVHKEFHVAMVNDILTVLSKEELPIFLHALSKLCTFFKSSDNPEEKQND